MSFHCSAALAAGFSLPDYLDGLRSERSKSNRTPETLSCNGKTTDTSTDSLFGTTCEHSTPSPGVDSSTLCRAGSRAKTSVRLVKVQDSPATVRDFGLSTCEWLRSVGLRSSLQRTVPCCELADLEPSCQDCPSWGMTLDGACWGLGIAVRPTDETGCGLLPTLTASDVNGPRLTPRKDRRPDHPPCDLRSAVRMLPTLCKRDYRDGNYPAEQKRNTPGLAVSAGGPLNPEWCEWLMGWPVGWTESKPLETAKFQSWLQLHGVC